MEAEQALRLTAGTLHLIGANLDNHMRISQRTLAVLEVIEPLPGGHQRTTKDTSLYHFLNKTRTRAGARWAIISLQVAYVLSSRKEVRIDNAQKNTLVRDTQRLGLAWTATLLGQDILLSLSFQFLILANERTIDHCMVARGGNQPYSGGKWPLSMTEIALERFSKCNSKWGGIHRHFNRITSLTSGRLLFNLACTMSQLGSDLLKLKMQELNS